MHERAGDEEAPAPGVPVVDLLERRPQVGGVVGHLARVEAQEVGGDGLARERVEDLLAARGPAEEQVDRDRGEEQENAEHERPGDRLPTGRLEQGGEQHGPSYDFDVKPGSARAKAFLSRRRDGEPEGPSSVDTWPF